MEKIIQTLLVLVFSATISFAADPVLKVSLSPLYTPPSKSYKMVGVTGDSQRGFFQYCTDNSKSIIVQKFTPKLASSGKKEISLADVGGAINTERVIEVGGKVYWFYSTNSGLIMNVREIDSEKGTFVGSDKELFVSPHEPFGKLFFLSGNRTEVTDRYDFTFSPDSSKFFIYNRKLLAHMNSKRENMNEFAVWVFDNNLTKIWGGNSVMIPYKLRQILNISGDNSGNLLLMLWVNDGSKLPRYELVRFGKEKRIESVPLSFNGKLTTNAMVKVNKLSGLCVVGVYNEPGTDGKVRMNTPAGYFLTQLNVTPTKIEQASTTFYPFNFEVSVNAKKGYNPNEADVGTLQIRDVAENSDGSLFIIGEEFEEREVANGNMINTVYFTAEVWVQYIDKDGKLIWSKKIAKRQKGLNMNFTLGLKLMQHNNNYYVCFIDNEKNLALPEGKKLEFHAANNVDVIVGAKLEPTGISNKRLLLNTETLVKQNIDIVQVQFVGNNTYFYNLDINVGIPRLCVLKWE